MNASLDDAVELPCGIWLANRLAKAAMSDSLGDGRGEPTDEQVALYRRWANGGIALSIVGEVQFDARFPEQAGNLVLRPQRDRAMFQRLAAAGAENGRQLWLQLGHAGALAPPALSEPMGPSALDLPELQCGELGVAEIEDLPTQFALAAQRAKDDGFGGVEIHAAHGFLLSQFLSPLFNRRTDGYGGSIEARARIIVAIVREVRRVVGPSFGIGIKLNSSDQLEGGLTEAEGLIAAQMLAAEAIDLLDISGGTYFPGAANSSDRQTSGPYFADFARQVKETTTAIVMATGGVKTRAEAIDVVETGSADVVGIARSVVVDPELPDRWLGDEPRDPAFPRFESTVPGGVTAWYTMRLADLAVGRDGTVRTLDGALAEYEARDVERRERWRSTFGSTAG